MKHELTAAQTQEIAGYSYASGVIYYDVELEIVDHLAAWVEDEMNNRQISFEEAFEKMKKEFPKADLVQILKSKKKHIELKFSRLIEKEFLSFFTIPKLSLTIMLLAAAITFPYLDSTFQLITAIALGSLFIYYSIFIGSPLSKEIKAIRDMKRCELLSVKVKSRYELALQVIFIACNMVNVVRLFLSENEMHVNIKDPVTKHIVLQSVLVFFVLIAVLQASALTVRRNVLNKIVDDYPYAFTE